MSDAQPVHELSITRLVDVAADKLYRGWTEPALLTQWFCPKPWKTIEADIDLRPGGVFRTVMQSPEGQTMPAGNGCFLEVIPNRKLVFTDFLGPDYRPNPEGFFVAVVTFEPEGSQTRYTARAMHRADADRQKHADMGFEPGWNAALDQLVELARTL